MADAADELALAAAMIWVVHPLQTEAVTYIYQRLESLMGLFYLLTLYCFVRSRASARPRLWLETAVLCCGLGMTCKEVMVTAPLLVLWYDRVFVADNWPDLLRRRWGFYAALAATWPIVIMVVQCQAHRYGELFDEKTRTPWEYAVNQPSVILHYLRLTFFPRGQCLFYMSRRRRGPDGNHRAVDRAGGDGRGGRVVRRSPAVLGLRRRRVLLDSGADVERFAGARPCLRASHVPVVGVGGRARCFGRARVVGSFTAVARQRSAATKVSDVVDGGNRRRAGRDHLRSQHRLFQLLHDVAGRGRESPVQLVPHITPWALPWSENDAMRKRLLRCGWL